MAWTLSRFSRLVELVRRWYSFEGRSHDAGVASRFVPPTHTDLTEVGAAGLEVRSHLVAEVPVKMSQDTGFVDGFMARIYGSHSTLSPPNPPPACL